MSKERRVQNLVPRGLERVPSMLCPLSLHPHLRTETDVLTSRIVTSPSLTTAYSA